MKSQSWPQANFAAALLVTQPLSNRCQMPSVVDDAAAREAQQHRYRPPAIGLEPYSVRPQACGVSDITDAHVRSAAVQPRLAR